MLAAALLVAFLQTPDRVRDPWVFRAVFEDRPRQLIISLGRRTAKESPQWIAFNPETGIARKVWRGQVDLRGKVYDFSQENSRANGVVQSEADELLAVLPDSKGPGKWNVGGLTFDDGWRFPVSGSAAISSPLIDPRHSSKVYASFDEFGNRGRLLFRVLDESGKVVQEFQSSSSGLGANTWQWNYKLIESGGKPFRLEVSQGDAKEDKRIRNLRIFCDPPGWFRREGPASVRFLGYQVDGKRSVTVNLEVDGARVDWVPTLIESGWSETFHVTGLKPGQVLTWSRNPKSKLVIESNGEHIRRFTGAE